MKDNEQQSEGARRSRDLYPANSRRIRIVEKDGEYREFMFSAQRPKQAPMATARWVGWFDPIVDDSYPHLTTCLTVLKTEPAL